MATLIARPLGQGENAANSSAQVSRTTLGADCLAIGGSPETLGCHGRHEAHFLDSPPPSTHDDYAGAVDPGSHLDDFHATPRDLSTWAINACV